MASIAHVIVVLFGLFLIGVGFLMLFAPQRARAALQKAGSTPFINYAEITIRMIPAAAMVIYAEFSLFPKALYFLGWFMLGTSFILYFVPRELHHAYSLRCADFLTEKIIPWVSPLSFLFGAAVLYAVL